MHNYDNKLRQLAIGFCRLKGIGMETDTHINQIKIQFDEWDWEIGVGLYGFWRYADQTNNQDLKKALITWYEWQIKRGLPRIQINSTSPMIALTLLCKEFPRDDWRKIINDWADYLLYHAPKTEEGGLQHTVKERDNEGQLWDDTLVMGGLFLWCAGDLLDRPELKDEALYQFTVHARFLADPKTGFWYHGWTFEGRHNFANAFWGRGNAWVSMALPELLRLSPKQDLNTPVFRSLIFVWRQLIRSVLSVQRPEGYWTTILNDPTSPKELSATAGFAYALTLGMELGLIEPNEHDTVQYATQIELAVETTLDHINPQGLLEHASDGTAMGHDLQFYHDVGDAYTPYAQAIAMLLLCQCAKIECAKTE